MSYNIYRNYKIANKKQIFYRILLCCGTINFIVRDGNWAKDPGNDQSWDLSVSPYFCVLSGEAAVFAASKDASSIKPQITTASMLTTTTVEATHYLQENGVLFAPGKAANAGGVATSALEMSQNSERLSWSFEEVDAKLKTIMINICHNAANAAEKYGAKGNYVVGANIAGFEKVVDAMTAQGIV